MYSCDGGCGLLVSDKTADWANDEGYTAVRCEGCHLARFEPETGLFECLSSGCRGEGRVKGRVCRNCRDVLLRDGVMTAELAGYDPEEYRGGMTSSEEGEPSQEMEAGSFASIIAWYTSTKRQPMSPASSRRLKGI